MKLASSCLAAAVAAFLVPSLPLRAATEIDYGFENVPTGSYSSSDASLWPKTIREFTGSSADNLSIVTSEKQAGTKSLQMQYKSGEYKDVKGQFYVNATKRQQYTLTYFLKFESTFSFGKGAKLPGLAGEGDAVSSYANGCSSNKGTAWSTRYMWRENGAIKVYLYHKDRPDTCGDYKDCNYNAPRGSWFSLKQEVKTNTGNTNNGILKVWLGGASSTNFSSSSIRYTGGGKQIDQIFFSTFFGGSDDSWASPKDQKAWFDGFKLEY